MPSARAPSIAGGDAIPRIVTETTEYSRGGTLTSLNNIPQTWGQAIPFSSGAIRVPGYQIWSSDFYSIIATTTRTEESNTPANEYFGVPALPPSISTNESQSETAAIDLALSFGYDAIPNAPRVLKKLRFDGTVIYDVTTGENKFNFNIYYGDEGIQDPTIKADLGDLAPYYPGQIYAVTWGIVAPLPKQIDAEFAVSVLSGDNVDVFDKTNIEEGIIMPDYIDRILYVLTEDNKIWSYNLDTLEFIKTIDVAATEGGGHFYVGFWAQKQKVYVGQTTYHPGDYAIIYAIDVKTGAIKATLGQNAEGGPQSVYDPVKGMPYCFNGWRHKDTETESVGIFRRVATNSMYRVTYSNGAISVFMISPSTDYAPTKWAHGDANFSAFMSGNDDKLYSVTGNTIALIGDGRHENHPEAGEIVGYGNTLLVIGQLFHKAYNLSTGELKYSVDDGIVRNNKPSDQLMRNYPNCAGGIFGYCYVGTIALFTISTGAVKYYEFKPGDNGKVADLWDAPNGLMYDLALFGTGYQIKVPYLITGGMIKLKDWIRACYIATGQFVNEDITFTDIEDEVYGAVLVEPVELSKIMNDMLKLYRIEKTEYGNQLNFYRNRDELTPDNIAATVDFAELATFAEGQQDPFSLSSEITASDINRPMLNLNFIDIEADYATNQVSYKQPGSNSTTAEDLTVPLVLDKIIALNLLQNVYADAVAATTTHEFRLPYSLMHIGAGDILRIYKDNFIIYVRITEDTVNADFSVSVKASAISVVKRPMQSSALVPDKPRPPVDPNNSGVTKAVVIDTSALRDEDNTEDNTHYLQLAVLYSTDAKWKQGYLARQIDDVWNTLFSGTRAAKPMIYNATTALLECGHQTDMTPLSVTSIIGTWAAANNKTKAQLYANDALNLAVYGMPGRWEIVQFQNITVGKVNGILRGCRGTEIYTGLHQVGDLFIIITTAVAEETRELPEEFTEEKYKPVTEGAPFASGVVTAHIPSGNSLKPWAPSRVKAVKASGDITISFDRRDRKGGGWGVDAPLSDPANFEIDIYNGAVVVRTITVAGALQGVYSAANQATDGLSAATTLTVKVYQISASVGRGFGRKVTVNVQ